MDHPKFIVSYGVDKNIIIQRDKVTLWNDAHKNSGIFDKILMFHIKNALKQIILRFYDK